MKKENKLASPAGRKLNLSKRTISNLNANTMNEMVGGKTFTCASCKGKTCGNGDTCSAYKVCATWYTCP